LPGTSFVDKKIRVALLFALCLLPVTPSSDGDRFDIKLSQQLSEVDKFFSRAASWRLMNP